MTEKINNTLTIIYYRGLQVPKATHGKDNDNQHPAVTKYLRKNDIRNSRQRE